MFEKVTPPQRELPKYVYRTKGLLYFRRPGFPNSRLRSPFGTPEFDDEYRRVLTGKNVVRKNKLPPPPPKRLDGQAAALLTRDGESHFTAMERQARLRAAKAGRPYDLPPGWMKAQYDRQGGLCAVSGVYMVKDRDKHAPNAPSIDRIDSTGGYTKRNCRLVTYIVNCAINQFTDVEFFSMCRAVADRHPPALSKPTNRERTGKV